MQAKLAYTFWIPVRLPGLNEYISAMNSNRHVGNAMKRQWTDYVTMVCKAEHSKFVIDKPVHIHFLWYYTTEARDPDNIRSATKFILDGMVKAGMIPNDNLRWIKGLRDDFKKSKRLEGCELTIYYD